MASKLSDEGIAMRKSTIEKAEPYAYDAPEINTFDGNSTNHGRVMATFAKRILEEAGVL